MSTLFDHNREVIKKIYSIDDEAVDMLAFEASRLKGLSKIGQYPLFFHGLLALLTNLIYPLRGLRREIKSKNDDFIFVSCPDSVFRTKSITLIAEGLKYSIIYLPNFHVTSSFKYHDYFRDNGVKAFFPTIKLGYVLSAWRMRRQLIKVLTSADEENAECRKMLSVLTSYAIYDKVVKKYMRELDTFSGKWLLEHDKFYFMASVINLHQIGKTCTMLQHGIFFRPSFNFIPLFCDKVLCCSTREKRIYIENGVSEKRIEVYGAPLQTLNQAEESHTTSKHYDLLVMMTDVKEINIGIMRKVLSYIKENYKSVLVRMRPRSRKADEAYLAKELEGMLLSSPGTPIEDDISCCDKVVSFSEDANVEIAKMNKPFIVVWTEGVRDPKSMGRCATEDNYEDEIKKLMTQDFYSTFSKDQYKDILGETDIKALREKFEKYILN